MSCVDVTSLQNATLYCQKCRFGVMKPLSPTWLHSLRSTYPDEDQRAGVSHFVLPFRHLDHGKLGGTGALAQNLPHLRKTDVINTQTQTQPGQALVLFLQAGAEPARFRRQTRTPADGVRDSNIV